MSLDTPAVAWVDSHCHLSAPVFDDDRAAVVAAARSGGVTHIVNLPGHVEHFPAVLRSRAEQGCLIGYGIHPMWVAGPSARSTLEDLAQLRVWIERDRPDLIGEIGLDFFIPGTAADYAAQERFFVEQLKLAREYDLPVSLHVRRSQDALLKHLRRIRVRGGIAHAFNGSAQQAAEFIKLGFALGFGGTATYPQAQRIRALLRSVPLEHIVVETDAPDLPPAFLGGGMGSKQRNSPAYLPRIGAELAAVRGVPVAEFAAITTANALRVLNVNRT